MLDENSNKETNLVATFERARGRRFICDSGGVRPLTSIEGIRVMRTIPFSQQCTVSLCPHRSSSNGAAFKFNSMNGGFADFLIKMMYQQVF